MDRTVALRIAGVFVLLAVFAGTLGVGAFTSLAEALLVIGIAIAAAMLALGSAPRRRLVPVRAPSRRRPDAPR